MHDETWKDYPNKKDFPSDEQWTKIHYVINICKTVDISYCTSYFTYEYFRKYCYLHDTGFCFNTQYVYFDGIPRYIDKVLSEESYFQQSTIYDYYDLTFEEIIILKQIYEFITGEFP